MKNKGFFITIEGCEGVGKGTQAAMLKEHFFNRGIPAVFTREPGGTPLSEEIRGIILSPKNQMDAVTELLLYAAARREHVQRVIAPALEEGKVVVCDRFTDSTVAYQGFGRGLDRDLINTLNKIATDGIKIDLTLFLDLSPKDGFLRKGGCDKSDRMDSESLSFHTRVYEGFVDIAREERVATINAATSRQDTFAEILRAIKAAAPYIKNL